MLTVLKREPLKRPEDFREAERLAFSLSAYLSSDAIKEQIEHAHVVSATSQQIQSILLPHLSTLGFESERTGLFADCGAGLRPDYFKRVGESGIILEVERGKTTINNMDLLDVWKCHICKEADFLFLVVPEFRQTERGGRGRVFDAVCRRVGYFFEPRNYVNVEAAFVFGY